MEYEALLRETQNQLGSGMHFLNTASYLGTSWWPPVARTPCSQRRGHELGPWLGTKILMLRGSGQKKKEVDLKLSATEIIQEGKMKH